MSKRPPTGVRKPVQAPLNPSAFPPDEPAEPSAPRPAIWAEGSQAPAFAPLAFAEAGMLLAREDAGTALEYLSAEASAKAAQIAHQDWWLESRLGRAGRALPNAPDVARSLDAFALQADAARRLLFGLGDPKPVPAPRLVQAAPDLMPTAAHSAAHSGAPPAAPSAAPPEPDRSGDQALAAIRAVLRESQAVVPRRPATQPVNWETPPEVSTTPAATTPPVLRKAIDWGIVRVLAGSVLVFATPIGYGRALYRHLDGTDLREIVADCHRMRIN